MTKRYFKAYEGLPREIYFLFTAKIVTCMGSFIFPLLTLILTQKLGMSKLRAGDCIAQMAMVQGICLLAGGKLADVFGRKTVLLLCQSIGALFYILCAAAGLGTRMIQFLMIAAGLYTAASPSYDAIVADITEPENRKASYSLLYLGMNVGMTVSPLLGGLLFQNHLTLLFLLDGVTTLLSCVIIALFIRGVPSQKNEKEKAEKTEKAEKADGGKSIFCVFRKVPVLFFFILLCFLYNFCYVQWSFLLPLQFGNLFGGEGARFYSYAAALNGLIVITCTPPVTGLTARSKPLFVISAGGILYAAAFFAFSLTENPAVFLTAVAIFTFGEIATTINLSAFVANHSPGECRGRIYSIFTFTAGAGGAFGPLAAGRLNFGANYAFPWRIFTVLILAGAFFMFLLNRLEPNTKTGVSAESKKESSLENSR